MKYRKTDNNIATMLSSLVMIMLVVMVVGFFVFRTDGLTTGMKKFYVKYGSDNIMADKDNFTIVIGKEYKFDIINESDTFTNSESNYFVKIVTNDVKETKFSCLVNDTETKFTDITSLTNEFVINSYKSYFTLTANYDLTEMLQDIYKTENVVNCPTTIDSDLAYYKLVITSSDNETININFNLKSE